MTRDEWQQMVEGFEFAAAQRKHKKNVAARSPLPEAPEQWIADHRDYAEKLPEHLPQRPVMLRHAEIAAARLAEGDIDEAKFYMLQLAENWNNAEHDRWVDGVERQYAHAAEKRNQELKPIREAQWERWRQEAKRIAQEIPKFAGNRSELARRVKRNLNLAESEDTIRKRL